MNQKTVSASRPVAVADIVQSRSAFRPSPTEVAKKAYFSFLNEVRYTGATRNIGWRPKRNYSPELLTKCKFSRIHEFKALTKAFN
jgi:hypothetical protein